MQQRKQLCPAAPTTWRFFFSCSSGDLTSWGAASLHSGSQLGVIEQQKEGVDSHAQMRHYVPHPAFSLVKWKSATIIKYQNQKTRGEEEGKKDDTEESSDVGLNRGILKSREGQQGLLHVSSQGYEENDNENKKDSKRD